MTEEEFWREVGRHLEDVRVRRGWEYPNDVHKAGGGTPNYATVAKHEKGQFKSLSSLAEHTRVFQVSVVDVFRAVLTKTERPLKPEASMLLRQFAELPVRDGRLLLDVADRLFEQHRERERLQAEGPPPIPPVESPTKPNR